MAHRRIAPAAALLAAVRDLGQAGAVEGKEPDRKSHCLVPGSKGCPELRQD